MDNSATQQQPTEGNYFGQQNPDETTGNFTREESTLPGTSDTLNGTELFSLFTADIIRKKVLFTR